MRKEVIEGGLMGVIPQQLSWPRYSFYNKEQGFRDSELILYLPCLHVLQQVNEAF